MPAELEKRHAFLLKFVPIIVALAFILFKLYTATKVVNPETGRVSRIGLSFEQEQKLGLQLYTQVLKDEASEFIRSGSEVDLVKRVLDKLAEAAGEKATVTYNWEVTLIQSNETNAYCLPGGKIVVYTGIILIARHEAGLAVVLGHEMAHAISRHGAEKLFRSQITQALLTGIEGSLSEMEPSQKKGLLGLLGAGAKYGSTLPFSREQEAEADHIGLLYMARAGYDPQEAIAFWQRMQEQEAGRRLPEFLSTHPVYATRIQDIQKWISEAQKEFDKRHLEV